MNSPDDDRAARSQVTLRLDRSLIDTLDGLANTEGVDRTELVRRLLADAVTQRRADLALADYAAGRRSAWSAAETAGLSLYEVLDRIAEAEIPYRLDRDALERLREGSTPPPSEPPTSSRSAPTPDAGATAIAGLRARYRPATTRVLFVGESSPAGGTHFYRANSILYRATRDAFAAGLAMANPPEGEAFLAWFRDLGCWLVDLADRPVNRSPRRERTEAIDGGINALAETIRELQPERVLVVLRRIAPAVRRAARIAGYDDHAIDVLPFPVRQWRPVYVDQLAGVVAAVLGSRDGSEAPLRASPTLARGQAIAETSANYGSPGLHSVMTEILLARGNPWLKASELAREIADADLWRRPSDGRHPAASQISARARNRSFVDLFQTSDLGIRLRTP